MRKTVSFGALIILLATTSFAATPQPAQATQPVAVPPAASSPAQASPSTPATTSPAPLTAAPSKQSGEVKQFKAFVQVKEWWQLLGVQKAKYEDHFREMQGKANSVRKPDTPEAVMTRYIQGTFPGSNYGGPAGRSVIKVNPTTTLTFEKPWQVNEISYEHGGAIFKVNFSQNTVQCDASGNSVTFVINTTNIADSTIYSANFPTSEANLQRISDLMLRISEAKRAPKLPAGLVFNNQGSVIAYAYVSSSAADNVPLYDFAPKLVQSPEYRKQVLDEIEQQLLKLPAADTRPVTAAANAEATKPAAPPKDSSGGGASSFLLGGGALLAVILVGAKFVDTKLKAKKSPDSAPASAKDPEVLPPVAGKAAINKALQEKYAKYMHKPSAEK